MVKGVKTWHCLSLLIHKFEVNKGSFVTTINLNIIFFFLQAGTPMRDALSILSDMIQPGLLIIGTDYFIKVDQWFMKLENASLVLGLPYVFGFYHVLNIEYSFFSRPFLKCLCR